MPLFRILGVRSALSAMHWRKGLRTGLAVGTVMIACYLLGRPMGWPALGALQVLMVDNGGPYRSRMANILTVLVGGTAAVALGIVAGVSLPVAILVTLLFCFLATITRVLSQPIAASSVVILVCYIVAFGGATHTLGAGVSSALYFVAGGLWSAVLSLVLWPVDPFRPARNAVANVYETLSDLVLALPSTATPEGQRLFNEGLARFRIRLEAAQTALAATPARMASRTVRARNLAVLDEGADLMLARLLRFAELGIDLPDLMTHVSAWLAAALAPIEPALRHKPENGTSAFATDGPLSVDLHRSTLRLEEDFRADLSRASDARTHLLSALQDAALNIEIAYEAIHAIWTGAEARRTEAALRRETMSTLSSAAETPMFWLDTLRANLTLRSVMFRHALRLGLVVTIDVLLMHFVHITHGYWLAMTSIIVLQPYTGETVRRSGERVLGTVAGAILAAMLASAIRSEAGLIAVITVGATFAVALYAVDYAWYCFFLTPTIVLLTLPHLRDWRFAAVRVGMTGLGALIAVLAMLLLWPERESLQLPGLLARGAAADAAYLRATLAFWKRAAGRSGRLRLDSERAILAPARRLCGLATNDAEETLDHALIEHAIPLNPAGPRTERLNRSALTFTTYLRRLTQTITTLAAIGESANGSASSQIIDGLALRLDAISKALDKVGRLEPPETRLALPEELAANPLAAEQLRRLERQVVVLERTALELLITQA